MPVNGDSDNDLKCAGVDDVRLCLPVDGDSDIDLKCAGVDDVRLCLPVDGDSDNDLKCVLVLTMSVSVCQLMETATLI